MAVLLTLGLLGCDSAGLEEQNLERSTQALYFWMPMFQPRLSVDLVGHGLNGVSLNGHALEGHIVAGVSLNDVQMPKGAAKDLKLNNTLFKGSHAAGKNLKNLATVGAEFSGWLDGGSGLQLRIEDAYPADEFGGSWLWYVVSFASEEGWQPLCGTDAAGVPVPAVPLNGLWSYEQGVPDGGSWSPSDASFTFACEGFALAKCVALGYPPWAEGKICDDEGNGSDCVKTTLAGHHQACVRALRADYCGDGTSYTVDGVSLNLYDDIGIRQDSEDWAVEAEWDEQGARCVVAERLLDMVPTCADSLEQSACGSLGLFETGSLLLSEVPDSGSEESEE